jgi:hypothetical protein
MYVSSASLFFIFSVARLAFSGLNLTSCSFMRNFVMVGTADISGGTLPSIVPKSRLLQPWQLAYLPQLRNERRTLLVHCLGSKRPFRHHMFARGFGILLGLAGTFCGPCDHLFIVACIAPAHSSRTLTMSGFLQIVQMCTSVSTHLQVAQSAESVSFHLRRYLLLRDMPHMLRTLILRSFSVSLRDQIFCISSRWSIWSSALYALWLSTGTMQENSSLLAMRVEEVIFCLVVVTKERALPTMRSPLSAKEHDQGTTDSSFQGAMGVGFFGVSL